MASMKILLTFLTLVLSFKEYDAVYQRSSRSKHLGNMNPPSDMKLNQDSHTALDSLLNDDGDIQLPEGCDYSGQAITQAFWECTAKNPSFMLQMIGLMNNPKELNVEARKLTCSHQKDTAGLMVCVGEKETACLPQEIRSLLQELLFNEGRWEAYLAFQCQHQEEFEAIGQCFNDTSTRQQVVTCFKKGASVMELSTTKSDIHRAICSAEVMFDACFEENRGACSTQLMKVLEKAFKTLLPADICNGVDTATLKKKMNEAVQKQPTNKLLSSLLIHGQPQGDYPLKYELLAAGTVAETGGL